MCFLRIRSHEGYDTFYLKKDRKGGPVKAETCAKYDLGEKESVRLNIER